MSRTSRSLNKRTPNNLLPQSTQINLTQCCALNLPEEWKIITKKIPKNAKKFICLTINNKKPSQNSSRQMQSKQTRSRELSNQSSRQIFQKVKNDFMEQLKLWKYEDSKISGNQRPNIYRHQTTEINRGKQTYICSNPQEVFNAQFYKSRQAIIGHQNIQSGRKWMRHELNSIEEVGINYETSEGLVTQNSTIFEKLRQNKQKEQTF